MVLYGMQDTSIPEAQKVHASMRHHTLHRNRNIIITLKLLFKIFCNSVFVHFNFPGCLNISKSSYSKGKPKILKSMSAEETFGPKTEQGTEEWRK